MRRLRKQSNLIVSLICSFVALHVCGEVILLAQEAKPVFQRDTPASSIEVNLRPVRMLPESWEFELSTRNSGSVAVFIMTDPVRSNGSKGTYLTLDSQDPSILNIVIRLYPLPDYCIYSNHAGVTLMRLDPGVRHVERVTISFPGRETSPPYNGPEFQRLDRSKLRAVRAAVGILPDEEGVQDFLRRKEGRRIGPSARGSELVAVGPLKGKSLYEIQEIIRSSTINF